ncbi:hypothetical protein [Asaia astilbis]|uniref:hypothetical protein n=1 Tax=Asaia astilbis TaxID=610244 RepID=UPI0004724A8C|nr:hypothetical protein [Asaia astilbis]
MDLDWQQLLIAIQPFIPQQIVSDLTLIGTAMIALCAIVARFWPRPRAGSNWLVLYEVVNRIAMNSKHAANANDTAAQSSRDKSR